MQRIEARVMARSGGHDLTISSVYQVANKLIVISKITTPRGASTSSLDSPGEIIIVKTGSQEPLEVIHYLLNNKKNRSLFTYQGFIPLGHQDDIKELLQQGELIYAKRFDHLRARRLQYFEAPSAIQKQTLALQLATRILPDSSAKTDSILNIFTAIDGDSIKIIFEEIVKSTTRTVHDAVGFIRSMARLSEKNNLALETDFLLMADDCFNFQAKCANEKTKCG